MLSDGCLGHGTAGPTTGSIDAMTYRLELLGSTSALVLPVGKRKANIWRQLRDQGVDTVDDWLELSNQELESSNFAIGTRTALAIDCAIRAGTFTSGDSDSDSPSAGGYTAFLWPAPGLCLFNSLIYFFTACQSWKATPSPWQH